MDWVDFCGCARWARRIGKGRKASSRRAQRAQLQGGKMGRGIPNLKPPRSASAATRRMGDFCRCARWTRRIGRGRRVNSRRAQRAQLQGGWWIFVGAPGGRAGSGGSEGQQPPRSASAATGRNDGPGNPNQNRRAQRAQLQGGMMDPVDFCRCARWARRIGKGRRANSRRAQRAQLQGGKMGRGIQSETAALSKRSYRADGGFL